MPTSFWVWLKLYPRLPFGLQRNIVKEIFKELHQTSKSRLSTAMDHFGQASSQQACHCVENRNCSSVTAFRACARSMFSLTRYRGTHSPSRGVALRNQTLTDQVGEDQEWRDGKVRSLNVHRPELNSPAQIRRIEAPVIFNRSWDPTDAQMLLWTASAVTFS